MRSWEAEELAPDILPSVEDGAGLRLPNVCGDSLGLLPERTIS
ncbi:hypothetical protein AAFM79_07710 [Trichormus azollae HNT15244]